MIFQGSKRYPITAATVHCADTRPDWMAGKPLSAKVAEIRRWHVQERGWRDIGYHRVIDRDGQIMDGRPLTQIGAHVGGHNTGNIGICLLGGYGSHRDDPFRKNFTDAQADALLAELDRLRKLTRPDLIVKGHHDYDAGKACPGFDVAAFLRGAR